MYNLVTAFAMFLTLMTASQTEAIGNYGGYGGYRGYGTPTVYAYSINNIPPAMYASNYNHNPPPSSFYGGLPAPYLRIYDKYYVQQKENSPPVPTSFYGGYGGYGGYSHTF
jgi:hypothetical protein